MWRRRTAVGLAALVMLAACQDDGDGDIADTRPDETEEPGAGVPEPDDPDGGHPDEADEGDPTEMDADDADDAGRSDGTDEDADAGDEPGGPAPLPDYEEGAADILGIADDLTAAPAPEQWLGTTVDGRLVVVDTVSGEEIRTIVRLDNPMEAEEQIAAGEPAAGFSFVGRADVVEVDGVQMAVFDICCEPAAGNLSLVPLDGSVEADDAFEDRFADAYDPVVGPDGRIAAISLTTLVVYGSAGWGADVMALGDFGADEDRAVGGIAWAPDGSHLVLPLAGAAEAGGATLHAIRVSDELVDLGPLPGVEGDWGAPAFLADGTLVAVEVTVDGTVLHRLAADGDVMELARLDGVVTGLRADPSGTNLIAVRSDGTVVRVGVDGQTSDLASGFSAAAWVPQDDG